MNELDLFTEALAIQDTQARAAFLDQHCQSNPLLRQRLDELLTAYHKSDQVLPEVPAIDPQLTEMFTGLKQDCLIGTIIAGKYKLLEEIGEGGMGTVFVAEQTEPVKRKVALKLIKAGMDSKSVLARFDVERQALAMMDHPNIAKVLDGGLTDQGRPYFAMEYVKGVSITEYCDTARLNIQDRLKLFMQVCQAVQHAHQKGIIHRDLKPSNILVAPYDDKPVPKIIDFGLAKAMHQSLTSRTLHTAHEMVLGTPLYMSPEQAQLNNLDVDTRSDIYSLGVLLYELLTGTTPLEKQRYRQAAWDEVRRIIREEEPPRPSVRLSSVETLPSLAAGRQIEPYKLTRLVKGDLDWIVMKALEKNRTRRYETANGFAADILRYLANETIVARPPSTIYRMQKTWQRNKFVFIALTAIAASLLAGILVSIWQATRAEREAIRAIAALDELRETAPAFVEQARGLAAREQFSEAIEKLDYAAKLRPDEMKYLVAKGDLLQCQLRFAEAATAYRAALLLRPEDGRAKASASLCDELLSAPRGNGGKLTRESLSKLHLAMLQQQRPAAELMPVARLLGEEKKLVVAYWAERLKDLPISSEKPLLQRLSVRDDGLLALDLSGTKIIDLAPLVGAPLATLNVAQASELNTIADLQGMNLIGLNISDTKVMDLSPLSKMRSLERLVLHSTPVTDITPLQGLRLKKLDVSDCPIRDISPLRGAPLEEIDLSETRVTDLKPLIGMPLKSIHLTRTPVLDFKPLSNLPLEKCCLQYNRLTDLAIFQGMPLRELVLWGCVDARNYAVLAEIKTLELLLLPTEYRTLPDRDLAAIGRLRNHPKLRQLGSEIMNNMGFTATGSKDVFWRDWDREQSCVSALRKNKFVYSLTKLPDETYRLAVNDQPLSDLSFIKNAPIRELWLNSCKVSDLTPLQGLPLRVLGLHNNPVADLRPLRGIPLEELSLEETLVDDLTSITGLHLKKLFLHNCEQLHNISGLSEMSTLEILTIPAHVDNIDTLRKLPSLKWLAFSIKGPPTYLPITTATQFWQEQEKLGWLRSLPKLGNTKLHKLDDGTWYVNLDRTQITDLSILRGAPISILSLSDTMVSNLEPLRGMAIKHLYLFNTKVTDLRPLKGMPLEILNVVSTKVSDITPLKDMPMISLRLHDCTTLADLSPLVNNKTLKELTLPTKAKNIDFLRRLPKLERLSFNDDASNGFRPDKTVTEFWQEYDSKK